MAKMKCVLPHVTEENGQATKLELLHLLIRKIQKSSVNIKKAVPQRGKLTFKQNPPTLKPLLFGRAKRTKGRKKSPSPCVKQSETRHQLNSHLDVLCLELLNPGLRGFSTHAIRVWGAGEPIVRLPTPNLPKSSCPQSIRGRLKICL